MARDRQRSKQRQAERRARRLGQEGVAPAQPGAIPGVDGPRVEPVDEPRLDPADGPGLDPDVVDGAPPEELGRSDYTLEQDQIDLEAEQHIDDDYEADDDYERADDFAEDALPPEDAAPSGEGEAGYTVRGRRGREAREEHKDRPRVVQFLIASWAELQRVQWPNRQALVTLTGVVLGFVLIAGGYLGLLDAIFSELIQAIL